jgi:hypothetical protein
MRLLWTDLTTTWIALKDDTHISIPSAQFSSRYCYTNPPDFISRSPRHFSRISLVDFYVLNMASTSQNLKMADKLRFAVKSLHLLRVSTVIKGNVILTFLLFSLYSIIRGQLPAGSWLTTVADSGRHVNEPLSCIKFKKFSAWPTNCQLLKMESAAWN